SRRQYCPLRPGGFPPRRDAPRSVENVRQSAVRRCRTRRLRRREPECAKACQGRHGWTKKPGLQRQRQRQRVSGIALTFLLIKKRVFALPSPLGARRRGILILPRYIDNYKTGA